MQAIKLSFYVFIVSLTALWLCVDTLLPTPFTYFSFRTVFMQYSGVIAIGAMSIAMLIAARPTWLEPHLNGLDKMYRLHKWLGIAALVSAILHWWFGQGTKWMVGWGWLTRPPRGRRPDVTELGLIEGWLRSQRGLAETVGEWVFYVALVLMVLALIKRFPYHWFKKTHKWLAVAYLLLAFHTVVLAKVTYWKQPIGWLLAALLIAGCYSGVLILLGRVGVRRKVQGTIESLTYYPALRVLETHVALAEEWPGHAAGQFSFVTSGRDEDPHPYTIASAWNPDEQRIAFITKALGDHTSRLHDRLKVGMPVTVEGPYGCFDFRDEMPRQIWIGAGIGITPFVARMKQLAASREERPIDLFHPTSIHEQAALDKLSADAEAAGIRAHIFLSGRDERLDGAHIRAMVPDWKNASIWFCGPSAFGQSLRADFIAHGLSPKHFHLELFAMR